MPSSRRHRHQGPGCSFSRDLPMQVNEATDPQRIVIVSRAGSTHSLFLEGPLPRGFDLVCARASSPHQLPSTPASVATS